MNTPVRVSIVVPARNEGERIAEFIAAHRWAEEIICVDNGSTDDTAARAREAGAVVIDSPEGTIADARNRGAEAARYEWILALDTDERADTALAAEVARVTEAGVHQAYQIRRRNFYLGTEQRRGRWGRDWVVRLYRRPQQYTVRQVHEVLVASGSTGSLEATLSHEPYRDLTHHYDKMNRYARWGAEELYAAGRRASSFDLLIRPRWRFFKAYILTGHVLDGRFGLVTAMLGAETALMKYTHLWAIERERRAGRD